jgi:hypothetical protein
MATVLFRCPNVGIHVTAWFADDAENGDDMLSPSPALPAVHFINPKTGKLLGSEGE